MRRWKNRSPMLEEKIALLEVGDKVGRPGPGRRDVIKDCAKESVGGHG